MSELDDELLTVEEVAQFAKLSTSKIYHDVEAGKIPVVRWGKRVVGKKPILRFKRSEIELWLANGSPSAREFEEKFRNRALTGGGAS
jgi:excisionase family DNA binding protein